MAPCHQTGALVDIYEAYLELGFDTDYARFRNMQEVIRDIYNFGEY